MKKVIIIILLFLVLVGSKANAEEFQVISSSQFFADNACFAIWNLKWEAGNLHSVRITEEWGVVKSEEKHLARVGDYIFGYVREKDGWINLNQDSITFLQDEIGNDKYSQSEYKIEAEARYQVVDGILIGRKFSFPNWKIDLEIKGKLLKGVKLEQRHLTGKIEISSQNKAYLSGFRDGIYSKYRKEGSTSEPLDAAGYSLSSQINWQIASNRQVVLEIKNLLSRIRWHNLHTSIMKYQNTSLGFYSGEKDSYSIGNYSYEDYETILMPEYRLAVKSDRSEWGILRYRRIYPYFNYLLLSDLVDFEVGLQGDFITLKGSYKQAWIKAGFKNLNLFTSTGALVEAGIKF